MGALGSSGPASLQARTGVAGPPSVRAAMETHLACDTTGLAEVRSSAGAGSRALEETACADSRPLPAGPSPLPGLAASGPGARPASGSD